MGKNRVMPIALIGLLALALRWRAALMLPIDYSEPAYTQTATEYSSAMQASDWAALLTNPHGLEYPSLTKLLYAFAPRVGGIGSAALPPARAISLFFGTLEVAVLAWLNPLAGFLLAIHTLTIKYTSQAYLEAVPALSALLAVLALDRALPAKRGVSRWLALSAVAVGVMAASNYRYLVAACAIALVLAGSSRRRPWPLVFWVSLAGLVFWVLNVQLWADPVGQLRTLLASGSPFLPGPGISGANLPWYQQLLYLSHSVPWHPGVFLVLWDTVVFVLGALGLPLLWRRRRTCGLWLVLGILALLLWPSRWPEQAVLVTAPLCLAAGMLLEEIVHWFDQHTPIVAVLRPFVPDHATTLFLSAMGLGLLVLSTYLEVQYDQEMQGWTYLGTQSTNIPSNTVRALALDGGDRLWAGTEAGAARWDNGTWVTYNTSNSGLTHNLIRAITVDSAGRVWFGTDGGLCVLDGEQWLNMPLPGSVQNSQILCLTALPAALDRDPALGPLWLGTADGALYFDGAGWTSYTPDNSGLAGARVLSIAVDRQGTAWFGTWGGLSSFDGRTWTSYTTRNSGLAYGTVSSVVIDQQGQVWCGTLDGVSVFDGARWRTYSLANSTLRFNTATTLAVDLQDHIWVGGDLPAGPMGAAAMFDGAKWIDHSAYFSGVHQAPIRGIVADREDRIWFATLLEGVVVYDPSAGQP